MNSMFRPLLAATVVGFAALTAANCEGREVAVTGDVSDGKGRTVGTFDGTFDIRKFDLHKGDIYAFGKLQGKILNQRGGLLRNVAGVDVKVPLTGMTGIDPRDAEEEFLAQATCQILTLSLGPLDLELLGLIVHLDEVNLDISADPAGGLLGQLLCALADGLGLDLGDLLDLLIGDLTDLLALLGALDEFLDLLNDLL